MRNFQRETETKFRHLFVFFFKHLFFVQTKLRYLIYLFEKKKYFKKNKKSFDDYLRFNLCLSIFIKKN